jgi:hypothetical protein
VDRHKRNHLAQQIAKAQEIQREDLVAEVRDLKARLWRGLARVEAAGNDPGIVAYCRELRNTLEQLLSLKERGQELGPVIQRFTLIYGLEGVKLTALRIIEVDPEDLEKARNLLADLQLEMQPEPKPSPATRRYLDSPPVQPSFAASAEAVLAGDHKPQKPPARPARTPVPRTSEPASSACEESSVIPGWNGWLAGGKKL